MVASGRKVACNSLVDALADSPLSRQRVGKHVSLNTSGLPHSAFYKTFYQYDEKTGRMPRMISICAADILPGAMPPTKNHYRVAIIVNYVKRADLPDDFYRSHYRWQARSFWFTLVWLVVSSPLFLLFWVPGMVAWCIVWLWYLYRFVRGWLAFHENRPMPVPSA